MKLTAKSNEVFEYIKANGGKVSIDELATALDRTTRSVNANVTDLTMVLHALQRSVRHHLQI